MAKSAGIAVIVSIVLHGLVGLSLQADGGGRELRIVGAPILVGLGPGQAGEQTADGRLWLADYPQPEPLTGTGSATVRCRSDGRGHMSKCRWLAESGPGWGDEAVERLNSAWMYYGDEGRIRGEVTVTIEICAGLCPIP